MKTEWKKSDYVKLIKMAPNYTMAEIADKLGRTVSSIQIKIHYIRKHYPLSIKRRQRDSNKELVNDVLSELNLI